MRKLFHSLWVAIFCWCGLIASATDSDVIREWRPEDGAPPAKNAWTPSGGVAAEVREPEAAAAGIGRVWHFRSKASDRALAYNVMMGTSGFRIENGWFEFSYWLPADSKVERLRPGFRVREGAWKGKLIVADITPVKGKWTTVRWPLKGGGVGAALKAGAEHVESVELGVLAASGPIVLEIGRLAIGTEAASRKPDHAAGQNANRIYSTSLVPEMLGSWNAERPLPAFATVWAPGQFTQMRTIPSEKPVVEGEKKRVFRFETDSGALALSFRYEAPLADCRLEFAYYLPEGSSVRSVNPGLNVREWDSGRRTLRLPPVTGRWQREKVSFSW